MGTLDISGCERGIERLPASANLDAAAAAASLFDQAYLRGDLLAYLRGVADDAHLASLDGLEVGEGIHDQVERGAVEVAEALVDEEGIY